MIAVPSCEFGSVAKDHDYYTKLPSEDEVRREVGWIFNKRMLIIEGNIEKPLCFSDLERCIINDGDLFSKNQIIHMKVVQRFKSEKGENAKVKGSDMKAMSKLSKLISVYVSDVHENQLSQIKEQNKLLKKKEIDGNSPNLWKVPYDEFQIAGPVSDRFVEMIDHEDVYCPKYHYNFSKVNQCIQNQELLFGVEEFNEAMKNVPNNLAQNLVIENKQLNDDNEKLNNQIVILNNDKQELNNQISNLNNQISDLNTRFDNLEKINKDLKKDNDDLKKKNDNLEYKINKIVKFNEKLIARLEGVQNVLDEAI